MARRTPSPGLSPKLLKHFAAATVVLTALLALFASGEDWGAQAQVRAVETRNELARTEAEKFGTRKVATTLKVANNVGAASFGDDEGAGYAGFGGSGSGYAQAAAPRPALAPLRPSLRKPRSQMTADPLDPSKPPRPLEAGTDPAQAQPTAPPAPSAQDLANITASSARRSGSEGGE